MTEPKGRGSWSITRSPETQSIIAAGLTSNEPIKVIARRVGVTPAAIRRWKKTHFDRGGDWSPPPTPVVEASVEGSQSRPDQAREQLWTMLHDRGAPASARVAAFEKLQASESWGSADPFLPAPLSIEALVNRVLALVSSLPSDARDLLLAELQPPQPAPVHSSPGPSPAPPSPRTPDSSTQTQTA